MGPVVRVLMNLIKRQGLGKAVKTAQQLGFKNTEIKKAVAKLGSKRKPRKSFNQRKEARNYAHIMRNDPNFNRRAVPRRGYPSEARLTKEYQAMGPEQAAYERQLANRMGGDMGGYYRAMADGIPANLEDLIKGLK